jgi:hypothetical protein
MDQILWKGVVPPPLTHLYAEEGRTLSKTYEIKARCYWEHTWGTCWEHRKNEKKSSPLLPAQNLKEKNQGNLNA